MLISNGIERSDTECSQGLLTGLAQEASHAIFELLCRIPQSRESTSAKGFLESSPMNCIVLLARLSGDRHRHPLRSRTRDGGPEKHQRRPEAVETSRLRWWHGHGRVSLAIAGF